MNIYTQGHCTPYPELFNFEPHPELFKIGYVHFTPERIAAVRKALGESRSEFAKRLWVSEEAIKNWEAAEGTTKHRELPGPAGKLMLLIEAEALQKNAQRSAPLRRIIERKKQEFLDLERRYAA